MTINVTLTGPMAIELEKLRSEAQKTPEYASPASRKVTWLEFVLANGGLEGARRLMRELGGRR